MKASFYSRRVISFVIVLFAASTSYALADEPGFDFLATSPATIGVPSAVHASALPSRSVPPVLSSMPALDTRCAVVRCSGDGRAEARDGARASTRKGRPALLIPLYGAFATTQVLEVHSTLSSIERGAHETNGVVATFTSSPTAMIVLKSASSAAVVYLTEKLWRKNRWAAVLTMAGLDAAYSAVVVHNYSVQK